jgi:hypothetical protein
MNKKRGLSSWDVGSIQVVFWFSCAAICQAYVEYGNSWRSTLVVIAGILSYQLVCFLVDSRQVLDRLVLEDDDDVWEGKLIDHIRSFYQGRFDTKGEYRASVSDKLNEFLKRSKNPET